MLQCSNRNALSTGRLQTDYSIRTNHRFFIALGTEQWDQCLWHVQRCGGRSSALCLMTWAARLGWRTGGWWGGPFSLGTCRARRASAWWPEWSKRRRRKAVGRGMRVKSVNHHLHTHPYPPAVSSMYKVNTNKALQQEPPYCIVFTQYCDVVLFSTDIAEGHYM